ncbi:MAG: hypothetical protein ABJF04_07980 [Reichenbachiella sp.]|uniref:hypothetical protein n=1 Tax=Reichenbachiella sp. TaxID=2184521 RepID=UPI00326678E1
MKRLTVHFLAFLVLCSCTAKSLGPDEWRGYLLNESHGLIKTKVWNGISSVVSYRPTDAMIWQEFGYQESVSVEDWDSLGKKYIDHTYLNLSLSSDSTDLLSALGPQDPRYYEVLKNLSYNMSQNCGIVTACKDTLAPKFAQFFRGYGSGISSDVLLVFEAKPLKACESFNFYVRDIGLNLPILTYEFDMKSIEKIPQLKLPQKSLKE